MRTQGTESPTPRRRAIAALAALVLGSLALAAPVHAEIEVEPGSFKTSSSTSQAGGHPDLTTEFTLKDPGVTEAARTVIFNAPEGIFGNPNALTRCTADDYALDQCPVNSQAGWVTIKAKYLGSLSVLGTAPLFDMAPQLNETARFSFIVPTVNVPIAIPVSVRTADDYGLRFSVSEITQEIPLGSAKLRIWGMPAAGSHDQQRFANGSPGNPAGCPGEDEMGCFPQPATSVSIGVHPLIDNPTTCTGEPLVTELDVQSYQDPVNLGHAESAYYEAEGEEPAGVTGCEKLTFNPVLSGGVTTTETDSPSGLDLGFTVPQTLGKTPSPSQAKAVTVTLAPGLTINPDAADGQSECLASQANFDNERPGACPDNSKIGTVTLGTPALDGPLVGSIYIGEPLPGDQYRLFLILSGFGVNAKLVGSVKPDPQTGRLTAFFSDLPQVPFDEFDIHLFASDRGLMATPTSCGIYTVSAVFVPWNGKLANQTSERIFGLDSGPGGSLCPGQVRPFNPRLIAGTSNPVGGAFSNFHLRLERDDGDQFLGDLTFRMPPGFTGDLRGITYCPDASIAVAAQNLGRAEQAGPSCPASSQIGTTNVAAGPGEHPFHAVGRMYLSGPFKGAALSLAAITPALAGPYDYGTVVVRVALHIDPLTAQVYAASDTVPSIIGGIPIRMRSIQVNIDRPDFTINPTNCEPMSVDSQGIGDQGTVADFSSYFHAVNCQALGFKPRMTIRQLGGRRQTRRARNPRLRFDLRTRPGDANIKRVALTLPRAFAIDQRHLGNICSRAELASKRCAGRQPIGRVETKTPLLDQPLRGPAYAVSGFGKLPHVIFILDGQVTIMPEAESSSVRGGFLKTVVPVVPDAPVGHFRLTLLGGNKGYLVNTRDLCKAKAIATVQYTAQSGKHLTQRVSTKTPCGKGRKRPSAGRGR